ncbi:uncharacterized protein BP5553_09237 [Venustampulla echinocandica]|uniref:Uncharacterized protein n=1 Tax=Venustampulla echinocandica TaxID=2656787 RepID=A0A370TC72_9HELO|nr:uncharacterized protein BP5553_09237 [Venustampulla echinocandica]RDL31835.1 hypothetical protein BP5553_09237 [Venustampulla echinocandica]
MPLDPLTALGVASNIIQCVDFTVGLISKTHEIYKSADGALVGNQDLEVIARNLVGLTENLQNDLNYHLLPLGGPNSPSNTETRENVELGAINTKCSEVATELLGALNKLKVAAKHSKWKSFRKALRSVWDEDKIQVVLVKLSGCRAALDTELLISLRTSMNSASFDQFQGFKALDRSTHNINQNLTALRADTYRNQQEILKAIQQHHWDGENPNHVAQFSTKVTQMVDKESIALLRQKFLDRLSFRRMSDRQEEIHPAHEETFNWIYQPAAGQPWGNFREWLHHGEGLYWITGKAGSGKSTLMKYLYNNPTSTELLQIWAGDLPLITASYYFWDAGTSMQKSQIGLLQSLLYECLTQCEDLIPHIFPSRWRCYENIGDDSSPWSRTELIQAFDLLLKQDGLSAKFCFFVDGLDEYDGSNREIVELFRGVAASSMVKICLSSRPLLEFEDAFGKYPKLMLQDLTQNDIKLYTESEFGRSERFLKLGQREPERTLLLVKEIVNKSAGVFLWVILVTRSLLEGLQNCDKIFDLQRRLEALPADLEDLYFHMMEHVDELYKQQASHFFRIVLHKRGQDPEIKPLDLAFAAEEEPNFAITTQVRPLEESEISFWLEETTRRINSRCKGLLEARTGWGDCPEDRVRIHFLHKTVKDFMETSKIRETIVSQSAAGFNPDVAMMKSVLVQLKVFPGQKTSFRLSHLEKEFMQYAAKAEITSGQAHPSLMQNFYETANQIESMCAIPKGKSRYKRPNSWVREVMRSYFDLDEEPYFLSLVGLYSMDLFVAGRLEQDKQLLASKAGSQLLYSATIGAGFPPDDSQPASSKLVRLLLDHGADPNATVQEYTMWEQYLRYLYEGYGPEKDCEPGQMLNIVVIEVMRLLVAAGANPEACCWVNHLERKVPAVTVLTESFGKRYPKQIIDLKQLIRQKLEEKVGCLRAMEIEDEWYQMLLEWRRVKDEDQFDDWSEEDHRHAVVAAKRIAIANSKRWKILTIFKKPAVLKNLEGLWHFKEPRQKPRRRSRLIRRNRIHSEGSGSGERNNPWGRINRSLLSQVLIMIVILVPTSILLRFVGKSEQQLGI